MTDPESIDDRTLIEDAMRLVLAEAPADWTRVVAEFTPPDVAAARVMTNAVATSAVAVPARAQALVAEYQRRTAASWRSIVLDCDNSGALAMRTDPAQLDADALRRGGRLTLYLWGVAAIVAAAVLAVAIVGRAPTGEATLRPMEASESMSDEQARVVAINTVRVWVRERNERHLANLMALSCPDPPGMVGREIEAIRTGRTAERAMQVVAAGALNRRGPVWGLNTHLENQSMVFVLNVDNGELRVCGIGSAPVP